MIKKIVTILMFIFLAGCSNTAVPSETTPDTTNLNSFDNEFISFSFPATIISYDGVTESEISLEAVSEPNKVIVQPVNGIPDTKFEIMYKDSLKPNEVEEYIASVTSSKCKYKAEKKNNELISYFLDSESCSVDEFMESGSWTTNYNPKTEVVVVYSGKSGESALNEPYTENKKSAAQIIGDSLKY